jgi:Family of unknown function (DUF6399)
MTPPQLNPAPDTRPEPFRWTRLDTAQALHGFHDPGRPPDSQREFAREAGLPRSTLQYWVQRRQHPDLDPDLVAFGTGPAGERFLRRLVLALHLVFHQAGACGLRPLTRFLQLTQLDRFVAASYGSHQALAARLQADLIAFADEQRQHLAAAMAPRVITLCTDENFHGAQAGLVAIEPVSNFVLVEAYRDKRDGPTWTATIQQAVQGLPVEVIQLTSDQAKGLLACARDGLAAHHSPDLFHDQRELTQATGLALQRQTEAAQKELEQACRRTEEQRERQRRYQRGPRPVGRPPDFPLWIGLAERYEAYAAGEVRACRQRQEQVQEAVRGLADDYHPFDRTTGAPVTAEEVERRLGRRLDVMEAVVTEAGLGEKAHQAVLKARRWVVPLVATVAWFWAQARGRVEALDLPEEVERAVYEQLLPGLYWRQAAGRGRDAEQRRQLRELSGQRLAQAWAAGGPLARLSAEERARVTRVASDAAGLFRRSSSCVEGRNGQLSLHHHGQGALSTGRLRALTAVHNYLLERADGTTAAQRFFGVKPPDLFEWLLGRLPELPRPAKRSSQATPQDPPDGQATWPNP